MSRIKSALLAATLISSLLLGPFGSVALAKQSGLTVPSQVNEPITLDLSSRDLTGLSADHEKLLQVFVGGESNCCENKTPIAGEYETNGKSLSFAPRFEFVQGQDYVIRARELSDESSAVYTLTPFNIASQTANVIPEITAVYPSGETLPENALRFYLYFAAPMKPHVAFDYIKLVDSSGKVDDAAFMRFKQELWSADRKRLTVLMDPGRIKRGVATNLTLGPALHEGRQYKLVVEGGWPTANGNQVLSGFSKPFSISTALRELPNTDSWTINAPALHSKQALSITFDRPFDYELLHKDLKVFSGSGAEIQGIIEVVDNETQWRFVPDEAWADQHIKLVVDATLEDVAGNNFKDLLDHAVGVETKAVNAIMLSVDLR